MSKSVMTSMLTVSTNSETGTREAEGREYHLQREVGRHIQGGTTQGIPRRCIYGYHPGYTRRCIYRGNTQGIPGGVYKEVSHPGIPQGVYKEVSHLGIPQGVPGWVYTSMPPYVYNGGYTPACLLCVYNGENSGRHASLCVQR